jgi:RNA polymerase sigma factor (sigma-70 family)
VQGASTLTLLAPPNSLPLRIARGYLRQLAFDYHPEIWDDCRCGKAAGLQPQLEQQPDSTSMKAPTTATLPAFPPVHTVRRHRSLRAFFLVRFRRSAVSIGKVNGSTDDTKLLSDYATKRDEAAFAELARRHVNLVYSSALRQLGGDAHAAQDLTQAVFLDLARKAGRIPAGCLLAAWLYRHAGFLAANYVRAERRRSFREREAVALNAMDQPNDPGWPELEPVLDSAMLELDETDRDALLLRFFQEVKLAELGSALGISEEAARKRVDRALERLRGVLTRRGIRSTSSALGALIMAHCVVSAPAAVLTGVTGVAAIGGTTAAGAIGEAAKNVTGFIGMTKLKVGIVGVVILATALPSLVIQHRANVRLRESEERLRTQEVALGQALVSLGELSNVVAQASAVPAPISSQDGELLRLRGEVGVLKRDLAAAKTEAGRVPAAPPPGPPGSQRYVPVKAIEKIYGSGATARSEYSRDLGKAVLEFASEHQGLFPTNLEDAMEFLHPVAKAQTNMGPDQFELLYHGRTEALTNPPPEGAIILREKQPWLTPDGKWARLYVYGNGQGIFQVAPDGDFAKWESLRMPNSVLGNQ